MVFTDPPYNVNYQGTAAETSEKIQNDNMDSASFFLFLKDVFAAYKVAIRDTAPLYVCYASRTHRQFEDAMNANGLEVKSQIIWVKAVATLGWSDYRWKHEPIFYAKVKGNKNDFYGDRKQYTTWEEEKTDEQLLKMVKQMISKEEESGSTIWRFKREQNYQHPTQKPVNLIERAIYNSSKRGDIVLDLFAGSGSTLIACEKNDRVHYGMEIDPFYVDLILRRYEEFTGDRPEKI